MKSPKYPDVEMKKIIRKGIEIEYCPVSKGVWLDKGELEKLIDAYTKEVDSDEDLEDEPLSDDFYSKKDHGYYNKDDKHHSYPHHKKKRESLLSEIFDIF